MGITFDSCRNCSKHPNSCFSFKKVFKAANAREAIMKAGIALEDALSGDYFGRFTDFPTIMRTSKYSFVWNLIAYHKNCPPKSFIDQLNT
jgi:hypothetical protein